MSKPDTEVFIEKLFSSHLPYITEYLKKEFKREFGFADSKGIHDFLWQEQGQLYIVDLNDVPSDIFVAGPHYDEKKRLYYYGIYYNEIRFYLVGKNIGSAQVEGITGAIKEIMPAILFYLRAYDMAQSLSDHNFIVSTSLSQLFYNNRFNADTFLSTSSMQLSKDSQYCVRVSEYDEGNLLTPLETLRMGTTLKKEKRAKIYNFLEGNRAISIYPAENPNTNEVPSDYAKLNKLLHQQIRQSEGEAHKTRHGVGRPCLPHKLWESYRQALLAFAFGKTFCGDDFILTYDDLGIYSLIFNNQRTELLNYSKSILDPLMEANGEMDSTMMDTIRAFIKNDFHWKPTAHELFIHPNTLHYRIDKICTLCDIDLDNVISQQNLTAAFVIHDALAIGESFV